MPSLLMVRLSAYVPGATVIVAPGAAASIAAWIDSPALTAKVAPFDCARPGGIAVFFASPGGVPWFGFADAGAASAPTTPTASPQTPRIASDAARLRMF